MHSGLAVDADFPGGNILLERIDGDDIFLRQDLRDTPSWFYWAFRVRGAQGKHLTFHFTGGDVLGVRGPAMSYDAGASWQWLGDDIVSRKDADDVTFAHAFSPQQTDVLFAFCPTYTERNLDQFLTRFQENPLLQKETLCRSRGGKEVEFLRVGNPSARFQLLLTCRHHACEAMASYFLEGVLESILSEDETGRWFRANVDCAVVPFMDKDGVEAGDQGKNRAPHDHNRDYGGEVSDSIYPEVAALRRWTTAWLRKEKNPVVLDFHCPHIRANENEDVYFVGVPSPQVWREVMELSAIWEYPQSSALPFEKRHNLPFGEKWNTGGNYAAGQSFTKWASDLPEVRLTAAMEMPYANAGGAEVNPESCRALGRTLAQALRIYWEEIAAV
jgi:hypothetical protein